jgi:hypothetical protein
MSIIIKKYKCLIYITIIMDKTIIMGILLILAFTSCGVEPCQKIIIDPDSCGFGTYTFTDERGCPVASCRPTADFGCDDLAVGDSYYDGCNTCTCEEEGAACTEIYCENGPDQEPQPRIAYEGELCGGIAGFICAEGLECLMDGDYPDASGRCIKPGSKDEGNLNAYYAKIDYSCETVDDCLIKDLHNCCGYYPKCMNRMSFTDPQEVIRICQDLGISSVCGFPTVSSCSCIEGMCVGNP